MKKKDEREIWREKRNYSAEDMALEVKILKEIKAGEEPIKVLRANPLPNGRGFLAKHALVSAYREKVASGERESDPAVLA